VGRAGHGLLVTALAAAGFRVTVDRTRRACALPVDLDVTGTPRVVGPDAGLAVHRTVQEALTNTVRHAGPTAPPASPWRGPPGRRRPAGGASGVRAGPGHGRMERVRGCRGRCGVTFLGWPVLRQLAGADPLGRGAAVRSRRTEKLTARTESADAVVRSVCPYCAVGCGQRVYVTDGRVTQIEGDPDSPISRGRLCPKGSASKQLVSNPGRVTTVKYRRPHGTRWEELDLDTAMDMIADRVIATRRETWQDTDAENRALNRTLGIAHLGGATLDNEENYLAKKLYTALGAIQVENQARI
jgi:formate dehydrogenase major subunit